MGWKRTYNNNRLTPKSPHDRSFMYNNFGAEHFVSTEFLLFVLSLTSMFYAFTFGNMEYDEVIVHIKNLNSNLSYD